MVFGSEGLVEDHAAGPGGDQDGDAGLDGAGLLDEDGGFAGHAAGHGVEGVVAVGGEHVLDGGGVHQGSGKADDVDLGDAGIFEEGFGGGFGVAWVVGVFDGDEHAAEGAGVGEGGDEALFEIEIGEVADDVVVDAGEAGGGGAEESVQGFGAVEEFVVDEHDVAGAGEKDEEVGLVGAAQVGGTGFGGVPAVVGGEDGEVEAVGVGFPVFVVGEHDGVEGFDADLGAVALEVADDAEDVGPIRGLGPEEKERGGGGGEEKEGGEGGDAEGFHVDVPCGEEGEAMARWMAEDSSWSA